jgi:hypothetical protein
MKRLAIVPVVVLCLVIAVPLSMGSDPLKFGQLVTALRTYWHSKVVTQNPKRQDKAHRGHPTSNLYAVHKVAHPWKTGMPQWGVQVYWANHSGDSPSYMRSKARQIVDYIVRLNANSICISFPFFAPGSDASFVRTGPATPSPAHIGILIEEARHAHLRVTVRPVLEALPGTPADRPSVVRPADRDTWFASYRAHLIPYARVAQEYGAASFVIATELNSMEGDRHWEGLVSTLRRQFKGELAYDAAWSDYISRYVNMPVSHLGIDAYFPVDAANSASISELVVGWNRWLDRKTTGVLSHVLLSEIGIAPQDGAYATPGEFHIGHKYNPQMQANWYRTACTVARERDMAGFYVWSLDFNSDPDKPVRLSSNSPFTFAGRPQSEHALRACFATSYRVQQ